VSEVVVRLAVPGDEERIASLLLEAFSPFREQYTSGAFEFTTPPADVISERFSEGPIWLAMDGDEAAGTVSGLPEPGRFYIRSMAVKPGSQRGGVGQKLLEALETHARANGFDRLYLYTTFVLPGAKRLYEKNGFYVARETLPEEWFDMGGLEMEKKLT
jgi:ribosomal protein S18 acetylase RimI-like enzyme